LCIQRYNTLSNWRTDAIGLDVSLDSDPCVKGIINNINTNVGASGNYVENMIRNFQNSAQIPNSQIPNHDVIVSMSSNSQRHLTNFNKVSTSTVTMKLSTTLLSSSSNLAIVAQYFHEVIHAYLLVDARKTNGLDEPYTKEYKAEIEKLFGFTYMPPQPQDAHLIMSQLYVAQITALLDQYAKSNDITIPDNVRSSNGTLYPISRADYLKAVAWSGIYGLNPDATAAFDAAATNATQLYIMQAVMFNETHINDPHSTGHSTSTIANANCH
jgi:protein-tyrosine-phosphatase